MKCKLRKVGNSLVVTVPKECREGYKAGEDIELFTKEEVIMKINEFIAGTQVEGVPTEPSVTASPEEIPPQQPEQNPNQGQSELH